MPTMCTHVAKRCSVQGMDGDRKAKGGEKNTKHCIERPEQSEVLCHSDDAVRSSCRRSERLVAKGALHASSTATTVVVFNKRSSASQAIYIT